MLIRRARPSDNRQIAELCYIIWQDMELDIIQMLTKERVIKAIELSIVNVKYRTYYEHVWVYEQEGAVVGCIIAYPGKNELEFERQWLNLPLEDDIRDLGTPLPQQEAYENEIYIEAVATFPDFRGQGIATQLFKHLIETDVNAIWSLNCDYENEGALKLYQKLGFKDVGDIELYGHNYHHMILK